MPEPPAPDGRRRLPAVHAVLACPALAPAQARWGREAVRRQVAGALAAARGAGSTPAAEEVAAAVADQLQTSGHPRLRPVINATGIVLHTGLGRAPLAPVAIAALTAVAAGYSSLEFDLASGGRGDRHALVADALTALSGAEAAMVVNNNAGAVLLACAGLAAGREALVSRGELVEIGGSFRIPEVLAASGARLREVGTTNRTYVRDYAAAMGPEVAAVLRVHRSNFRLEGFAATPRLQELCAFARSQGLPLIYDMGSGALLPTAGEGTVAAAVAAGADLLAFSGDKLLGGPQAGIICGKRDLIARLASHPLARALRVDKLTLAALEATLGLYRQGRAAVEVPALAMLGRDPADLGRAARRLARACRAALGPACAATVERADSAAGAGALPGVALPTHVVALRPAACGPAALARALRAGQVPLVGRIHADALLLDPRSLLPGQERELPGLIAAALAAAGATAAVLHGEDAVDPG